MRAVGPKYPAQQILIATDFSEGADAALEVTVKYARALHAGLHLVHVFATKDIDVTRLLGDAAAQAGPDVPITVARIGGDPAEEILRYARRHPIDLIVVGTHGHTGAGRMLLGNVAERVVRGARCPVLVVPVLRQGAAAPAPAPAPSGLAHDAEAAQRRSLGTGEEDR
jgi:nucleotide-binding universal stress UspA family protein